MKTDPHTWVYPIRQSEETIQTIAKRNVRRRRILFENRYEMLLFTKSFLTMYEEDSSDKETNFPMKGNNMKKLFKINLGIKLKG